VNVFFRVDEQRSSEAAKRNWGIINGTTDYTLHDEITRDNGQPDDHVADDQLGRRRKFINEMGMNLVPGIKSVSGINTLGSVVGIFVTICMA
jgi:hypothetical protein